jgi:hypothetical protein
MRRRILLPCVFLAAPLVLLVGIQAGPQQRPAAAPQIGERLWEDGRIGVIIKKVETKDSLSCDVRDGLTGPPYAPLRQAKPGHTLSCIHLVLAKVKAGHVIGPGTESTLNDAAGRKYPLVTFGIKGLEFLDPHDISSPSKLVESSEILLLFEVPSNARPETLTFVYSFSDSWPAKNEEVARMNVGLPAAR